MAWSRSNFLLSFDLKCKQCCTSLLCIITLSRRRCIRMSIKRNIANCHCVLFVQIRLYTVIVSSIRSFVRWKNFLRIKFLRPFALLSLGTFEKHNIQCVTVDYYERDRKRIKPYAVHRTTVSRNRRLTCFIRCKQWRGTLNMILGRHHHPAKRFQTNEPPSTIP